MNPLRLLFGTLVILAVMPAQAQPAQELEAAAERLFQAGNYTWVEKQSRAHSGGRVMRLPSVANGKSEIGGYTRATIRSREMPGRGGSAVALKMPGGVAVEVMMLGGTAVHATGNRWDYGQVFHPLPHELLKMLLPATRDHRKQGGAIEADIDPEQVDAGELQRYLRSGEPPTVTRRPTSSGLFGTGKTPTRRPTFVRALLVVWVEKGEIVEMQVEFRRAVKILNGPDAGEKELPDGTSWSFEISDVGRTKVDVDSYAEVLLQGMKQPR